MTHRAPSTTLRAPPVGAALAVAAALTTAIWWLPVPTLARILADGAAVCTLGLAVVPFLDTGTHRAELARRAAGRVRIAGVAWLLAELWRLCVMAAEASGEPIVRLERATLWLFAFHTRPGQAITLSAVAAAVACAVLVIRAPRASGVVAVLAAAGLASRAVTGHVAATGLGVAAIALHALAAGLWCGAMAGLLLTVRHRTGWARVLPVYSRMALWCVGILLLSGVVGAILVIESPTELYRTGYGRVLTAKIVLAVVLVTMGWRNRRRWVPAARSRSISVRSSNRRAAAELAVMVAALVAAAILSLAA